MQPKPGQCWKQKGGIRHVTVRLCGDGVDRVLCGIDQAPLSSHVVSLGVLLSSYEPCANH